WIGPAQGSGDDPPPTQPVIAALYADGTGEWFTLADGWELGASSPWGTLLARTTSDGLTELAWFDPTTVTDAAPPTCRPRSRRSDRSPIPDRVAVARRVSATAKRRRTRRRSGAATRRPEPKGSQPSSLRFWDSNSSWLMVPRSSRPSSFSSWPATSGRPGLPD